MPSAAKPLFRPEALRPLLRAFAVPAAAAARAKLADWAKLLASKQAEAMKETELLPDFITDVFVGVLGYTGPAGGADRFPREVVGVDGRGRRAPAAADQLLLLGVHADHGPALPQEAPPPGDLAELPVPVGVAGPVRRLHGALRP